MFKVGEKVKIPALNKVGIVMQVVDGQPKLIEIDGELKDATNLVIEKIVTKYVQILINWLWTKLSKLLKK